MTQNIVQEIPVGTETAEVFVLWRERVSGGFFREAEGSRELVARELASEVRYLTSAEGGGMTRSEAEVDVARRYHVVRKAVTTTAREVRLDVVR